MGEIPAQAVLPSLNRIQEVRRIQSMSIRTAARQLGTTMRDIREREQPERDVRVSELYRWAAVLGVPAHELLTEDREPLHTATYDRGLLLRIMKTARTLVESATDEPTRRMAENLVEQLLDLMPELKEVTAWQAVGQRRTLDDFGNAGLYPILCNSHGTPEVEYD